MLERRGFLRGLASLPLIGGGVTLIGNPTAVAAAPEYRELLAYSEWLDGERVAINAELFPQIGSQYRDVRPCNTGAHVYHELMPGRPEPRPASTRAKLVLATVGCNWREYAL